MPLQTNEEYLNKLSEELFTAFNALNNAEGLWIDLAGRKIPELPEDETMRHYQETQEAKTIASKLESVVNKIIADKIKMKIPGS